MKLTDLKRKIALITGCNKGLGFEIALKLSRNNFRVIMADKEDQSSSKEKIKCQSSNNNVNDYFLDLTSFESVRCFAKQICNDIEHLDVLINNAGIFCMKKKKTVDCLDGVMQVNHLSPFLLTNLMINTLKKANFPRIIFVTSNGSFFNTLTVNTLKTPDYFTPHFISGAVHYYNTKLCNMICSKGFAEKYKHFNITSNCVHPCMMNTTFLTSSHKGGNFFENIESSVVKCLVNNVTRDVTQCVESVTFLTSSEKVANVTGKYLYNYQVHREPKILEDKKFCEEIWRESEKLVGLNE